MFPPGDKYLLRHILQDHLKIQKPQWVVNHMLTQAGRVQITETRRLMILTLSYVTNNQSEQCPLADPAPHNILPHPVFKTLSLKTNGEIRGNGWGEEGDVSCPNLLLSPAVNAALSFIILCQ